MQVLADVFRVLESGGRFLFSDARVIGGLFSHEEIATRSYSNIGTSAAAVLISNAK